MFGYYFNKFYPFLQLMKTSLRCFLGWLCLVLLASHVPLAAQNLNLAYAKPTEASSQESSDLTANKAA